jgi:hypothetical protein
LRLTEGALYGAVKLNRITSFKITDRLHSQDGGQVENRIETMAQSVLIGVDSAPSVESEKHASVLFFRLFQFAVMLRIWVSANMLNLVIPYSDGPGPMIFKIHPGSYLLIGLGIFALVPVLKQSQIRGNPLAIGTLVLMSMPFLMLAWSLAHGRTGGVGYLLDATLIGPMTVICLAYVSPEQRYEICKFMLAGFVVNSLIIIFEFTTHIRLTPYNLREAEFRPAGLLGHPLSTGVLHTAVIPALFILPISDRLRWFLTALFAVSVIASQARAATVACLMIVAFLVFLALRKDAGHGERFAARAGLVVSGGFLTLPIVGLALLLGGALDRISKGFVDQSTKSRVVIYNLFDYMTPDQFYYGMDYERAMYYVRMGLKIDYIESAIVVYIINFGVYAGVVLLLAIIGYALCLVWDASWLTRLVAVSFLTLVLSNNGLATKSAGLMFLAIFTFGAANSIPAVPKRRQHEGAG